MLGFMTEVFKLIQRAIIDLSDLEHRWKRRSSRCIGNSTSSTGNRRHY
jgi:hypothetical protein